MISIMVKLCVGGVAQRQQEKSAVRFESAHPAYGTILVEPEANGVVLKYFENQWPVMFGEDKRNFSVSIPLSFGLTVPLSHAKFSGEDSQHAESIKMPFALDPEVPPLEFRRAR